MRLFILVALLTIAPASPIEPRAAVMTALLGELAEEQRMPHARPAGRSICVRQTLSAMPLAGRRQPSPGDMKFDAPVGQPRLPWKPDTEADARNRLWFVADDLPPEEKATQLAIQTAALRASERSAATGSADTVDPAWLSANETLSTEGCDERITLSTPNIALDHAFIDVQINCGALCGLDATYVMRLQDGRWRIVDGRIHGIS